MEQRISLVTLGVADLARARAFYEALGWAGARQPDDEVCFFQAGGMVFGLWTALGGHGAPGIELAHNVRSPEEVTAVLEEAERAGDEYVQVTQTPRGKLQTHFLVERRDDLREIRMTCQLTGTYAAWQLTPAQGGTFINLEMGMQPKGLSYRLMDLTIGRRYFQAWSQKSLDALRQATHGPVPS